MAKIKTEDLPWTFIIWMSHHSKMTTVDAANRWTKLDITGQKQLISLYEACCVASVTKLNKLIKA